MDKQMSGYLSFHRQLQTQKAENESTLRYWQTKKIMITTHGKSPIRRDRPHSRQIKEIGIRKPYYRGKEKLVRRKQKDKRMEHIGKIVAYLILAINAFFVGTLILSAYSPYLSPKVNPLVSCLGLAFPIFLIINLFFLFLWAFVNYRYALLPVIGFLICFPQIRTYISFQLYYPDNTGRKYQSSVFTM